MKRAVVLLSGGVDSTTTLAIAKAQGFEIYALSFDYGQRHKIELKSARKIAESFNVKKHLVINFNLRDIGGSALTSDVEVPKDSNKLQVTSYKLKNKRSNKSLPVTRHSSLVTDIPVTYVPARNTIFLSFALAWAEVLGAEDIFIGANAIDFSGYPDCRPEFIKSFEDMANLATKVSVEGKCRFKIHAPLINLTKSEIIKKGIESGIDYSLTWSCYDPQKISAEARKRKSTKEKNFLNVTSALTNFRAFFVPCMKCDSCLLRAKGFKEAGVKDPLV
ncbi:MAG: 7-cyano-7-deazaguanine synthase QueC [Nitrospirae bacterium]|nr:7-cyano-7-deazaguanine synthase QueC [Nitrospirota bacterium]